MAVMVIPQVKYSTYIVNKCTQIDIDINLLTYIYLKMKVSLINYLTKPTKTCTSQLEIYLWTKSCLNKFDSYRSHLLKVSIYSL